MIAPGALVIGTPLLVGFIFGPMAMYSILNFIERLIIDIIKIYNKKRAGLLPGALISAV